MNQEEIISKTINFVKVTLANAEGGHDWWHIKRVYNLAKKIAKNENANQLIVELGALLHDIADFKFHNNDELIGAKKARKFLLSLNMEEKIITHVEKIIINVSFKGEKHIQKFKSLELNIIQDADRLDAIGAIGIARTFSYGGHKNRPIYDPNNKFKPNMTKEEYLSNKGASVNHFYEKILLLKDKMNTKTGKKIAEHRHEFMESYLEEFYKEWEGEL